MLGFGPIGSAPISALPDDFSVAFNLDGQESGRSIIHITSLVDRALIQRLHQYPDDLRFMDRRKYEEVIAEIFLGFGYEVELTQRTRDGGKDIVAIKHVITPVKFLIECKRPDPGNPTNVSAVRELYGVKCDDRATKAILASTTYFTPDAKKFSSEHLWELELRDFEGLRDWIAEYVKIRAT